LHALGQRLGEKDVRENTGEEAKCQAHVDDPSKPG
jgi:hypothetical protein